MPDLNTWNWPQYAIAGLYLFGLLIAAHRHGTMPVKKYNFWDVAIGCAIGTTVLYFGNFWTPN